MIKGTNNKLRVMNRLQSAIYLALVASAVFFTLRYFIWWINLTHIPLNWTYANLHFLDVLIFITLTFAVFLPMLNDFGVWFALWFMSKPKHIPIIKKYTVAFLTCYVPGKEPIDMLEKTLTAMKKVRYEHDTWVLDEGDDSEVKLLCKRLDVKHFSRKCRLQYNQSEGKYRTKTKADNHNAWLNQFEDNYDIIAQIDMDHIPEPDYFERTLGQFEDPKVGIICMPQYYKNTDNWIARGSAEQAYLFHGPIQQGYYGCDMPFLIGTSHIYRRTAMKDIDGYAPTIVEDHLTGMLFYSRGWKGVFVPEVLARGDGPTNWLDYFNQQMRWSFGLFEILFNHTPKILDKLNWQQKINYFTAQLYYFSGVSVFLGTVLTFFYLVFGINSAHMNLLIWLTYSVPTFILGILIQIYVHQFTIDPKKEPVYGIIGMFLNLGANLIYTLAFFKFIAGKKMQYMVTKKGSMAIDSKTPIEIFIPHLVMVFLMTYALASSFVLKNNALQLRLWAVFSIISLSGVVGSSHLYYFYKRLEKLFNVKLFLRYSFVAAAIVLVTFLISGRNTIDGQVERNYQKLPEIIHTVTPFPNVDLTGAMLGISFSNSVYDELLHTEEITGLDYDLVGFYQAWGSENNQFDQSLAYAIKNKGSIPMITWEPWVPVASYDRTIEQALQDKYHLRNIIRGDFDEYIKEYANSVRDYQNPVMIRFAHEMNGNWYPWGSTFNTPSEYIMAWRHVHDIFTEVGTPNVAWIWAPNEEYVEPLVPFSHSSEVFYPGDKYVDWVGVSSFNWAGRYKQNIWRKPEDLFESTISKLKQYQKPIIITETASSETIGYPGQKALWIEQMAEYVKLNPEIKGLVWFNVNDNNIDWSIESSDSSLKSFINWFGDSYFN
ncbi:hypothetical protein A3A74_01410 [Candidatus Roizmanbacteria bacterium RIFCSPLOWO2_01_FULL_35_13]|uniref:GH26 domain-containing protein n=1 Tax=Candidatus Roizmanbacteria bacterium RIFCSPLOWO2_01_FULL_35_13 TaxID=1802055 RepID=A0A1F7IHJ4_9BACT|nr:MAG: hypothetical protein A3A74_01410 [Candidatus Roizmanbacteria bacterium RIFCSPLOWO2_01_FULL_35_13]